LAVSDDKEEVVRDLVDSVVKHNKMKEALESTNEEGDTPLHPVAEQNFCGVWAKYLPNF
jgi:hypothetical protein